MTGKTTTVYLFCGLLNPIYYVYYDVMKYMAVSINIFQDFSYLINLVSISKGIYYKRQVKIFKKIKT